MNRRLPRWPILISLLPHCGHGRGSPLAISTGPWARNTRMPRKSAVMSCSPLRWQGRGEQLMTADFLGIRVFLAHGPVEIAKGDPRPCPQCGSSEIKIGHLGTVSYTHLTLPTNR